MSLENISSALFTAGSGGIVGFLIGYAIKRVLKILAVIIGLFFGAIMYFQSQSILAINWDKLQSLLKTTLPVISNLVSDTGPVNNITGYIGIPLMGGLSVGLVLGFTKG